MSRVFQDDEIVQQKDHQVLCFSYTARIKLKKEARLARKKETKMLIGVLSLQVRKCAAMEWRWETL